MAHAECTPAVERALAAARRRAAQEPAREVVPEHLLRSLLQESEGRAASLLRRAGLPTEGLEKHFQAPAATEVTDEIAEFGPAVEAILASARALALEWTGEATIGSDHLLVAVVQADLASREVLERAGLDMDVWESVLSECRPAALPLEEPLHLGEPTEAMQLARILDANANRAREAARVLEDYSRFVLDDACLSGECKRLRHELVRLLQPIADSSWLEARDTVGDVGTKLTTPHEQTRASLTAVLQANAKRLQEALRTLEEYLKIQSSPLGQGLEQLRYQSYTLEKALLLGTQARQRLADARLYLLVTADQCLASLDWTIAEAMAGGVQMIQLREKGLGDRELLARACAVRRWTREAGVLFIMNDRVDLARLTQADGVHLGQDDLPVRQARQILGPDAIVGVSTHHLDQVRQAVLDGASYLGVGPTFPSATKSFDQLAGLDFVRAATGTTSLPTFVIGGVSASNLPQVLEAGGRRIAVSSALSRADDPRRRAQQLRQMLDLADSQASRSTEAPLS